MKKLLLLITALLALGVSGVRAQTLPSMLAYPEPGKVYYIAASKTGTAASYVYYDSSASALRSNKAYVKDGKFEYLWLCSFDGTYYQFKNLSNGKYMNYLNVQDGVYNFNLSKDVTNTGCCALYAVNEKCWMVTNIVGEGATALNKYSSNKANTDTWNSDYLFEEYAATVLSHNQYYYIYCDNDANGATEGGDDIRQYLYNNEGALKIQTTEASVSIGNYDWRAQQLSAGHFSLVNNSKYLAFHTLADAAFDWQTDRRTNNGRVSLWGYRASGTNDYRYMLINYADTDSPNTGGFANAIGSSVSKGTSAWSPDYMFVIAPKPNVYKVVIQTEGGSSSDPVFTFDGIDYSGDSYIYVDSNNLPETKTITLKSYDDVNYIFQGFELEDGTTLGNSIDVSALSNNKGVKAIFASNYKVTYVVKDANNNTLLTSDPITTTSGAVISTLPNEFKRDFCSYNEDEIEVTISNTGNTNVEFICTWNGPFDISSSYATAHWYDMSVRSTWYVTSDNLEDGALKTVNANALGLATDPYQWAFVGNPYNLKLYNKDKGEDYVFAWTSAANQNVPVFVAAATGNTWTIKESTASGYSNAFLLTIPEYGYQVNQFGGEGGSLKIWNSTGTDDAGSAFKVFDVPSDFSEYVTSEIAPYMENDATYFNWTDAARTTIGYNADYKTSCPYAKYAEMKNALTAALADLNSNVNFPATGYYRLRNRYYPAKYLGQESNLAAFTDGGTKASTVVKLTKHDSENKYTIQIQGKYIQTPEGQASGGQQVTTGVDEVWFTPTAQTIGFASFKAGDDDYGNMHCSSSSTIVGWTYDAQASHWAIEDATSVTLPMNVVGESSYGTLYLPFDVELTTPVGLCTVSIDGTRARINSLGDATQVPAEKAILMVGAAATTEVSANIISSATAITADNNLVGTYTDKTTLADNEYIFGTKDEELGFWKMASGNKVGANKAYLIYDGATDVKGFSLDFSELTGINEIAGSNTQEKAIFDLSGRRIQEPTRGLYIVNGKKVIVK